MKPVVTIITPYHDGVDDPYGDYSPGIRVFAGQLSLEQILRLTQDGRYAQRAAMHTHGDDMVVIVTFCAEEGQVPLNAAEGDPGKGGFTGTYFDESIPGLGSLRYHSQYCVVEDLLVLSPSSSDLI